MNDPKGQWEECGERHIAIKPINCLWGRWARNLSLVRELTLVGITQTNSGHFSFCALVFPTGSRVNTRHLLRMENIILVNCTFILCISY